MFEVVFGEEAIENLRAFPAFLRNQILDKINEQLVHQPTRQTRNKKALQGLIPPWKPKGPMWELRVGEYRVFYEVDLEQKRVMVRALRHKPPHLNDGGDFMKIVGIKGAKLEACVKEAQRREVVITKKGKPLAVIVSANGMDLEQLELAYSEKFWKLVDKWRKQKTISREELEKRLAEDDKRLAKK